MSKSKDNWREEARRIIRAYPSYLRAEQELRDCRITPSLTGMPGGGGFNSKTETAALKELSPKAQRELDAVRMAIQTTKRYRNSKQRLQVVEMVYWQKSHTLEGAAQLCHYSYAAVKEWNAEFIGLVDSNIRLLKSLSFSHEKP